MTSDTHRLLLNLTDKTDLEKSDKYVALSNRNINYTWKNVKTSYKNQNISSDMKWRIWINRWIIFCIRYSRLSWIYLKKHGEKTENPSIRIYVNKIEIRITFKIK